MNDFNLSYDPESRASRRVCELEAERRAEFARMGMKLKRYEGALEDIVNCVCVGEDRVLRAIHEHAKQALEAK